MARVTMRVILSIAAGFGLRFVASGIAVRGDVAHARGDIGGALLGHSLALALTLAALGCFVFGLWSIFRKLAAEKEPTPQMPAVLTPVAAEPAFDPDAVMARYLANRAAALPPPPSGFGRKGR